MGNSGVTRERPRDGERVRWNALRLIYRLLATAEAQKIVRELIREEKPIGSTTLRMKTELQESQFHPTMKQLVNLKIVDREVDENRRVTYSLSLFGKNVLQLTEPLLVEIKEKMAGVQLAEA